MKFSLAEMLMGALALILPALFARFVKVSGSVGIKSFSVEPGPDMSGSDGETRVAGAIKPTGTIGQIMTDLNAAKGDVVDRKFIAEIPALAAPGRVLMFPIDKDVPGDVLDGETLLGTLTRDDVTKENSAHTFTAAAGLGADPRVLAIQAVFAASKPKRNFASAINAAIDAFHGREESAELPLMVEHSQAGNGATKLYQGGAFDSTAGSQADVQQVEAEVDPLTPGMW